MQHRYNRFLELISERSKERRKEGVMSKTILRIANARAVNKQSFFIIYHIRLAVAVITVFFSYSQAFPARLQ